MNPQYSAFWISKVLLPASHAVMFAIDGLSPSQIKSFLQDVYYQAQGHNSASSNTTNTTICGFSIQAATEILLDLQQSNQNFQRFVSGSPLLFFLFLLLMCQYEKTPESQALGTRDSSVMRSRKFISCLQASLFSLPSSESLRASNIKGSFYTLMTSLSQRNILLALDGLAFYPSSALNTNLSKQVIQSFFDDSQLPNANAYFPTKASTTPQSTTIPTSQPIPTNTASVNTASSNSNTNVSIPNIQITRPTVDVSISNAISPSNQILPPISINIDAIEQVPSTQVPSTQIPSTQIPSTQIPATQVPTTQVPSTQVPSTQVPSTQVPTTQVPTTQASSSQNATQLSRKTKGLSNQTVLMGGLATIGIAVLGYWLYKKSNE